MGEMLRIEGALSDCFMPRTSLEGMKKHVIYYTNLNSDTCRKARSSEKGQLTTLSLRKYYALVVERLMYSCLWDVSWRNVSEKQEIQLLNFFVCHDHLAYYHT
jgi:hypothetical protein